MKVAELLESRQQNWRNLEDATLKLSGSRRRGVEPAEVLKFGELYRSACADLALAQAYRLPPQTIEYLHQLVASAHNVLYRSERFRIGEWGKVIFVDVPRRLYHDYFLRLAFVLFWGFFLGSGYLAYRDREFASNIVGEAELANFENMYSKPPRRGSSDESADAAGFYVMHNTGIGLRCFASGVFLGIGSLFTLCFNAIQLGTVFGYMAKTQYSDNFFEFVTAHGPFELTAIVLSAGAGVRLGFSLIQTHGLSRMDSLRNAGRPAFEIVAVASILFILAAFIEGFVSPSELPYSAKLAVAVVTGVMLVAYFGVLGRGAGPEDAA